jgi:hypothetical protein
MKMNVEALINTGRGGLKFVRGVFCYIATRRAEGDHYVDLNFREGVVEPKIQPRAINSAQGLMGYFQKVF